MRLPWPGIQLVYTQLVNPLSRIVDESTKLANGLIFVARENVNRSRYARTAQRHVGQFAGCSATLDKLAQQLEPILNNHDASAEDLSSLRGYIQEILSMARALLKVQREAQSMIPPTELAGVHELYVRVTPALLRRFAQPADGVRELVEGKFTGNKLDLSIDLNVPELFALNQELARISNEMHSPRAGCFIATAAFGSELEPRVIELRRFRDAYLDRNGAGRALIALYECVSPVLANGIESCEWLRWAARKLLCPLVFVISWFNRRRRPVVLED